MDATRELLLERERLVFVDADEATPRVGETDLARLEADLLALGCVVSPALYAQLRRIAPQAASELATTINATIARSLGSDRPHVPLFRRFPHSTPPDTSALYRDRIFAWLLQEPEQPCVLCGRLGTVAPLDPCAHLVCSACWDGSDLSGCPICHRRIAIDDPFLDPPPAATEEGPPPGWIRRLRATAQRATRPAPLSDEVVLVRRGRLELLRLGTSVDEAASELFARLTMRTTPLPPQDRDALAILLGERPGLAAGLPDPVPVRETMALVLGTALPRGAESDESIELLARHAQTATDVLRIAVVAMGGDPGLDALPGGRRSLGRALRRALLDRLEALPPERLVEDVLRHGELWKRVARGLHPFEDHARRPRVALAFAVLRRVRVDADTTLGQTIAAAASETPGVTVDPDGRLRFGGWASAVERALADADGTAVAALLRQRPGELLRRLDHAMRVTGGGDELVAALEHALPRATSPLLLTVLAHLRHRHTPWARRVFLPKGSVTLTWSAPDERPPLPADVASPFVVRIERELLRRAGTQPPVARAVLDEGLADLLVPFGERSASRALVRVPRGSALSVPGGTPLRLFLHWMEDAGRVDLDLSVLMYDEEWSFSGLCDYTELVFGDRAAVHSGDLTSAPPPLGASEFVDLDVPALLDAGVRHLVFVVFSYNDVPFDAMKEAFAGFMSEPAAGTHFDAAAVEQRFDLTGQAKIAIPLTVDLVDRRMRWLDVNLTSRGDLHNAWRYERAIGLLAGDLRMAFEHRMTMWELACLHAAARAPVVEVRRRDGAVLTYVRGDEPAERFLRRLRDLRPTRDAAPRDDGPWLVAAVEDDLDAPPGSVSAALRHAPGATAETRLALSDLVAALVAT